MDELTARERRVLDAVVAFRDDHGYVPTRREIARLAGFATSSAATYALQRLEAKGRIRIASQIARGIQVLRED